MKKPVPVISEKKIKKAKKKKDKKGC